jgi:probable phosphoglycerate mutase
LALTHGVRGVVVKGDLRLVVDQINGTTKTKHPRLLPLRAEAAQLLALFEIWSVEWIERKENWRADALGGWFGPQDPNVKAPRTA